jgi:diketogulonate reductase-like aldo/keto reductase
MNYKELGQTGVRLPEIGLGTWEYKGGVAPLRRGIDLGASLIDTAEAYGTEEVVGLAISNIRDKVFIATKVWPTHFRYRDLLQAADNSLQRLRTDYIDLYQLHWPNAAVPIDETIAAMERLVEVGKVRFIGACNFSVHDLKRAQACVTRHKIVSSQVHYSLVERRIEFSLLPYCRDKHMSIIAYSPLECGINHIGKKDPGRVLSRVAAEIGKTEAQVALNWCISKEGVITIPKADSIEHITDNCHASGWRLSSEHIRLLERSVKHCGHIEAALRRTARRLLQKRYRPESVVKTA